MPETFPRIAFPLGFTERDEWEMERKGYVHAIVEVSSNARFAVCFYHPGRLTQDLESSVQCGIPCVADPGMIVVPDVTRPHLQAAVEHLVKEGYFDSLAPLAEEAVNKALNPNGNKPAH